MGNTVTEGYETRFALYDLKHWLNIEWAKLDHAVIAAAMCQ